MRIPVDTLLFDFDGTLVETNLDFTRMRRQVLALAAHYGIAPPEGLYILEIIAHAQQQLITREPQAVIAFAKEAERILIAIETEGAGRACPLPGVQETLQKLCEQGAKIGIVTRNCRPAVEQVLTRCPLPHEVLLTRDDVDRVKPDPAHLLEAVRQLDSLPEWAIMVGDHPMDILAGQRAGMHTAAITFTHPPSDFIDVHPDLVIDSIPQMWDHIVVATLSENERPI